MLLNEKENEDLQVKFTYTPDFFQDKTKLTPGFSETKKRNYIVKLINRIVGIKFDIISSGKLYSGKFGLKKYYGIKTEISKGSSV